MLFENLITVDSSPAEISARRRAINSVLSANLTEHHQEEHVKFDALVLAAVAATIHPRHLWAFLEQPPAAPATTPWAIQSAVKAIRSDPTVSSMVDDVYLDFRLAQVRSAFRNERPNITSSDFARFRELCVAAAAQSSPPASTCPLPVTSSAAAIVSCTFSPRIRIRQDEVGDGVNGRVVFAQQHRVAASDDDDDSMLLLLPKSTTVFRVPSSLLFNARTVAEHSKLGKLLSSLPWKDSLDSGGEALLLLTLLFELIKVGPVRSHWKELLLSCPKHFPHMPICWPEEDLMFLDPAMFEIVAEKGTRVTAFVQQSSALLKQISQAADADTPLFANLHEIVNEKSVTWARCVFDSRSFVLNFSGQELTCLAPAVDMLNHDACSDLLHRKIEPESGDFIMVSGPPVFSATRDGGGKDSDEQEVYLCYGPLETWDLLTSYGFVPAGAENGSNPYDTLLLPLSYDDGDGGDDECGHDDDADEADPDGLSKLRREAIRACGLELLEKHGLFIPVSGEIPVAVRHIVAIWFADSADELRRHIAKCNGPVSLSQAALEKVDAIVKEALELYLSSMPTTQLEDEALLEPDLDANKRAAVVARLTLKRIAQRALNNITRE